MLQFHICSVYNFIKLKKKKKNHIDILQLVHQTKITDASFATNQNSLKTHSERDTGLMQHCYSRTFAFAILKHFSLLSKQQSLTKVECVKLVYPSSNKKAKFFFFFFSPRPVIKEA